MLDRLKLSYLAFFGLVLLVACQGEPSPATPTLKTVPVLILTDEVAPPSTSELDELAAEPICFTPQELIPFAFSLEAAKLFVRTGTGVQVFDLQTGELESDISSSQNVVIAALSPDGQTLAWSLQDNTIQLIDLSDQTVSATLVGHPDPVFDLRFSPTGDKLFSASHDGLVRIWDSNGTQLSAIEVGREVLGFGLSWEGSKLATIPSDGPVLLWDLTTGQKIGEFGSTGGYDTSDAHFSPDDQYLAADLATGLYLWRISSGELLWNEIKNSMGIALAPDGKYLAYSDVDAQSPVILASPDGSQIIRTLGSFQGPVWEMFFSPDGSLLAATDGIEIRVWQVGDGQLLAVGKSVCP